MKVAIATDNNQVSAHFGRCRNYIIFDVNEKEIIEKTVIDSPPHQPGMLPGFLHQKGVNCVICGGMGPRAQNLFMGMNIEPVIGVTGNVDDVIRDFLNGTLQSGESLCDHGTNHHQDCQH
jgi:predicted Fe-Mo cluster-binding NifX family protein